MQNMREGRCLNPLDEQERKEAVTLSTEQLKSNLAIVGKVLDGEVKIEDVECAPGALPTCWAGFVCNEINHMLRCFADEYIFRLRPVDPLKRFKDAAANGKQIAVQYGETWEAKASTAMFNWNLPANCYAIIGEDLPPLPTPENEKKYGYRCAGVAVKVSSGGEMWDSTPKEGVRLWPTGSNIGCNDIGQYRWLAEKIEVDPYQRPKDAMTLGKKVAYKLEGEKGYTVYQRYDWNGKPAEYFVIARDWNDTDADLPPLPTDPEILARMTWECRPWKKGEWVYNRDGWVTETQSGEVEAIGSDPFKWRRWILSPPKPKEKQYRAWNLKTVPKPLCFYDKNIPHVNHAVTRFTDKGVCYLSLAGYAVDITYKNLFDDALRADTGHEGEVCGEEVKE